MPPSLFRNSNHNSRLAPGPTQLTAHEPATPVGESYLTAAESAQYLRSSTSTLAKYRLRGIGPPYSRIGRVIRYRRTDLDQWMASKLANSTSGMTQRQG